MSTGQMLGMALALVPLAFAAYLIFSDAAIRSSLFSAGYCERCRYLSSLGGSDYGRRCNDPDDCIMKQK